MLFCNLRTGNGKENFRSHWSYTDWPAILWPHQRDAYKYTIINTWIHKYIYKEIIDGNDVYNTYYTK